MARKKTAETELTNTPDDENQEEEALEVDVEGDKNAELEAEIALERERAEKLEHERNEALAKVKQSEALNKANADLIIEKEQELLKYRAQREEEECKTKTVEQGGTLCEFEGRYYCTEPCFRKGVRYDPDASEVEKRIKVFKKGEIVPPEWKKC